MESGRVGEWESGRVGEWESGRGNFAKSLTSFIWATLGGDGVTRKPAPIRVSLSAGDDPVEPSDLDEIWQVGCRNPGC